MSATDAAACYCAAILSKDAKRHFKECPLRKVYPDGPPDAMAANFEQDLAHLAFDRVDVRDVDPAIVADFVRLPATEQKKMLRSLAPFFVASLAEELAGADGHSFWHIADNFRRTYLGQARRALRVTWTVFFGGERTRIDDIRCER